jgi:hypothetical protein
MILSVHGGRITFECDEPGCHRSITVPQGAMAPRIFKLKGWQFVKVNDGKTVYYCPVHTHTESC